MSNEHDLVYYLVHGFTEEQFEHSDAQVRTMAYKKFGWPEQAKYDKDCQNRREYYRLHGYTEDALKDPDQDIKSEAKQYFKLKEILKEKFKKSLPQQAKYFLKKLLEKNNEQ